MTAMFFGCRISGEKNGRVQLIMTAQQSLYHNTVMSATYPLYHEHSE